MGEEQRFRIVAVLIGPWRWAVEDRDRGKKVAFHAEREDAQVSAEQLNEKGYVDAS